MTTIKEHIEAGPRRRPNRDGSRPHARSAWLTRGMTVAQKLGFWSERVANGCLEWRGATSDDGYGIVYVDGASRMAHKVALEQVTGPLRRGICACHRCDNRLCIDPAHLFPGTRQDNNADMVAKGRNTAPRGEQHHRAKLTADDVRAIRLSDKPKRVLAAAYGVTHGLIGQIKTGRIWRSVS